MVSAGPIGSPTSTSPPGVSGVDLAGLAVADDHGRHGDLVEQRLDGVGVARAVGGIEVAARSHHLHLLRGCAQRSGRRHTHHVRLARARPHAQQCQAVGLREALAKLQLLRGHPVQPTQVEVVAARGHRGFHRLQVDPVGGRVDQHLAALQRRGHAGLARIDRPGACLAGAVALGRLAGAVGVQVRRRRPPTSSDSARSRTIAPAIVPAAPSTATSKAWLIAPAPGPAAPATARSDRARSKGRAR